MNNNEIKHAPLPSSSVEALQTTSSRSVSLLGSKARDYYQLVKFRLTMTVVFSSVMAYLIAVQGPVNWIALLILALGGFLVTGASNALNQVLEKEYDRLMKRTADRPLAAGRMKTSEGVLAAGLMSLFGICLLALFNPWTALFGMVALLSYAFLYTPMKRVSPIAVLIGAIPGALPTLIGSVAATGVLSTLGLVLFALQFFWQFPHFWSIGWLGHDDYHKAGYRLLPTTDEGLPDTSVGRQSFIYALFLLPVGIMPYLMGISGVVSAVIVVLLTLGYSAMAWNFNRRADRRSALMLMFFSFLYLPLALIALFADKL